MTDVINWRKSSRSGNTAECVEVGNWRKSTRSGNEGDCVEAGNSSANVAVRDTKLGESSPVLSFAPEQWRTFILSTKAEGLNA
jgi:hypothetical protein